MNAGTMSETVSGNPRIFTLLNRFTSIAKSMQRNLKCLMGEHHSVVSQSLYDR